MDAIQVHVTETADFSNLRGFVRTLERAGPGRVFALDCEMCRQRAVILCVRVSLVLCRLGYKERSYLLPDVDS